MLKVVVVEDEEMVRKGIVLAVDWAAIGCCVVGEAANGEDGLETVLRYCPDIVITDIRMPKMDGLEMVRQLREKGNDAYVIILTAYSDFTYAQSAIKLRAVDYLLKPFHDGELEAVVERVCRSETKSERQYEPKNTVLHLQENVRGKSKYVMETLNYIAAHYAEPDMSVADIANSLDISESHLSHVFKKETAYTLTGYLTSYRLHMAMQLLHDCRNKVYEVAEKVGYRDIAYFSGTFKKQVGVSPSEFQRSCQ